MGPIAPKDPIKQRDFYYIMLEKQICSYPFEDGKGVTFLYQNDGRIVSSSKIVGNVTDEEMLKLLRTTEGFRKLVFGIGVSMMTDACDKVDFIFQMYGKTDPLVSGTSIRQTISTDGVEYLIPLSEVEWSDDDKEPGQIRFEYDKPGVISNISIRFYLNDGFKAPKFEGIDKVDISSDAYRALIDKSVLSLGENDRIKKAIAKARSGNTVTLAYIGGSITQGAGATPINTECYPYKSFTAFKNRYCLSEPVYIKAGVGGTPSELGMLRFDRDVMDYGKNQPDIVVVEFAVNDAGDETQGECFEGLVRKALNLPGEPAVIIIFSVFADDFNLEDRLVPIGKHYRLPMVSAKAAVTDQFYLSKENGRVLAKSSYFYDCYHPTNIGHTIMADCITKLFELTDETPCERFKSIDYAGYRAYLSGDFENVTVLDRKDNFFGAVVSEGSFIEKDTVLQCVERNLDMFTTAQFPDNWMHVGSMGNEPFVLKVCCKNILIISKDSADPMCGKADVFVDGELVKTINPNDIGWIHCNPQIIFRSKSAMPHTVEVRMHEGDEAKEFTILGFGIVY